MRGKIMSKENQNGVSMEQLEEMAKRYKFEVFFCIAFVFATLFSYIFNVSGWSLLLSAGGAVVGMLLPMHTEKVSSAILKFVCKQEKVTQIIIAIALILLSIILPPVTFLLIGVMGGKAIHRDTVHHKGQHLHSSMDDSSHDSDTHS